MEKAKESVRQMQQQLSQDYDLTDQERDDLKLKINDMLFTNLPALITVSQMEALAFTMFDMVVNPLEYLGGVGE